MGEGKAKGNTMADLKEAYQLRAEELARAHFDSAFYDLPLETQDEVYGDAVLSVNEDLAASADNWRKQTHGE